MTLQAGGWCPLLQVFDMPTSIAFYRDVLGFEVVSHDGYEMCFQRPVEKSES